MTERWKAELRKIDQLEPTIAPTWNRGQPRGHEPVTWTRRLAAGVLAAVVGVAGTWVVITALGSDDTADVLNPPELFFPTYRLAVNLEALGSGELVLRDGCLFLASGMEESLLIWPEGSGTEVDDQGRVTVRAPSGGLMAIEGQTSVLVGGYVGEREGDRERVESLIRESIPAECLADTYWAVSPEMPVGGWFQPGGVDG